ncbi:MAG: rhodanese-like domain-containing protein [Chloroflexi bacterium]|jgi:rhodanese-related sulfurtransferase|nr:rhodanese-like domain-containing protein [Chloroflexota bacterium]
MDQYISPQDLNRYLGREQKLTIVDLRSPEEFQRGHIPTAINIPGEQLPDRMIEIPDEDVIVVYCGSSSPEGGACHEAYDLLTRTGHVAQIIEGGWPAWQEFEQTTPEKMR